MVAIDSRYFLLAGFSAAGEELVKAALVIDTDLDVVEVEKVVEGRLEFLLTLVYK